MFQEHLPYLWPCLPWNWYPVHNLHPWEPLGSAVFLAMFPNTALKSKTAAILDQISYETCAPMLFLSLKIFKVTKEWESALFLMKSCAWSAHWPIWFIFPAKWPSGMRDILVNTLSSHLKVSQKVTEGCYGGYILIYQGIELSFNFNFMLRKVGVM